MQPQPASAKENARNNITREIVETERKYVQELEHMQVSATLNFCDRMPTLIALEIRCGT